MKKRTICLMLALSLVIASLAAMAGCSPSGGSEGTQSPSVDTEQTADAGEISSPALVSTVTEYSIDFETNEWKDPKVYAYTYENAYPSAVVISQSDSEEVRTEYEYTFDGGLPTLRKSVSEEVEQIVEYNRGRVYRATSDSLDGTNKETDYYQYANDDEYFTFLLHENHHIEPEDSGIIGFDMEETDSVSVTAEDGLLVKTVNTGMYANWNNGDVKEWQRFNGTYTAEYDADGIVKQTSVLFRSGPSGDESRFDVTKEDGRVTEVIVMNRNSDTDEYHPFSKFTFEYTDEEISAARYAAMINSFIMGETGNYYRYFWY